MKKKNKILYIIQKYVGNNWYPFTNYSTYIHKNVAEDILYNLQDTNPLTRYRIAVMLNNEMIDTYY